MLNGVSPLRFQGDHSCVGLCECGKMVVAKDGACLEPPGLPRILEQEKIGCNEFFILRAANATTLVAVEASDNCTNPSAFPALEDKSFGDSKISCLCILRLLLFLVT